MQRFDVFISHVTEDREQARWLEAQLEPQGYRCFVASDDLNSMMGTEQWGKTLDSLLASTPVLVLVVTARGLASRWVEFEWRSFHQGILSDLRAGLVIPLLFERMDPSVLPSGILHWQLVDLAEVGRTKAIADLLDIVHGFRRASMASDSPLHRRFIWSQAVARHSTGPPVAKERPAVDTKPPPSLPRWIAVVASVGTALVVGGVVAQRTASLRSTADLEHEPETTTSNSAPAALPSYVAPIASEAASPLGETLVAASSAHVQDASLPKEAGDTAPRVENKHGTSPKPAAVVPGARPSAVPADSHTGQNPELKEKPSRKTGDELFPGRQ